jgi:hypothetical protein
MQELVDAGAIDDRDYVTWDAFNADRFKWFLMNRRRPSRLPRHPVAQGAQPDR